MSFRPRSSILEIWIEQHNSVQTASIDPKICENIIIWLFINTQSKIELLEKLHFLEFQCIMDVEVEVAIFEEMKFFQKFYF